VAETITYYRGPWRWVADDDIPHWAPPVGCVGAIDLRSLPEMATPGKSAGSLSGVGLFAVRGALPSEFDVLGSGAAHGIKASRKLRDAIPARRGFVVQGDDLLSMARSLLMDGSDPTGQEFAKPLIPGADGRIRFNLGPLCRHQELQASSLKATYWSNVRDVLRADFASCFQDAKAGRMADAQQYRRVLDATCGKYGLDDWQELVPESLIKDVEGRLPHATTYTDDFNRADATGLGASWSNPVGNGFDIASNQARAASGTAGSGTRARYDSDLSSSDAEATVDVVSHGTISGPNGPCVRMASAADTSYGFILRPSDSQRRRVFANVVGVGTLLASDSTSPPSVTFGSGIQANGSAISVSVNGTDVATLAVTNTAISSGLRGGMQAAMHTTAGSRGINDNFATRDISAPPPSVIYTQLEKGIRGLNRGTYTQPGAG